MIKFDEYWNKVCISSNCEEDEARRHYEAGMMEQNNTMRLSTSPSLCGSEVMRSEFDTLEQYQESMKEFNENTRMGFEEFIQSHGSDRNKLQLRCTPYTSKKGGYGSFDLDFGLCVYQHQQSKVDELQKRVDSLTKVMEELLEEMKYPTATFEEVICSGVKELEQALKGGGE